VTGGPHAAVEERSKLLGSVEGSGPVLNAFCVETAEFSRPCVFR
jgi:hypothetical protein